MRIRIPRARDNEFFVVLCMQYLKNMKPVSEDGSEIEQFKFSDFLSLNYWYLLFLLYEVIRVMFQPRCKTSA